MTSQSKRVNPLTWAIPTVVLVVLAVYFVVQALSAPPAVTSVATPVATPGAAAPAPPASAPGTATAPTLPDMARRQPADPAAIGKVDAPVVMVAYTDFRCSYCAKWHNQTLSKLITNFVEPGVLRIEFRDLAIFGAESHSAAVAAAAAGAQGKYLAFVDALYPQGRLLGTYTGAKFAELASALGLDVSAFEAAQSNPDIVKAVQANMNEAMQLGVNSTPTFLINQVPLIGAQPYDVFANAVSAAAAKAG